MSLEAQALILRITEKNDEVAHLEHSNTCGIAVPANDDVLDALLADLPFDLPHVPAFIVTDETGAPVMDVVTTTPAPAAPASRSSAPVVVTDVVTKAPARTRRKRVRSGLRQRQDARTMRAAARGRAEEVVEHLPSPSSTLSSPTSPTKNANDNDNDAPETTKTSTGRGRMIAPWDDAGELPRVIAMNRALDRFGVPMAFSLNISPKLIKAGNDNARGQLDYHRRRIALALKRAFGKAPAMWVVIETEDDGRQHLHGGIALTDQHTPAAILKTLSRACGDWTTQGSAPADLRPQHDQDGWAVYPFKRAPRTRRDLREAAGLRPDAFVGLYAASAELLADGKRIHEEERQMIGRR